MASTSLKINGDRLNSTLQETCTQWGALSTSTGMCRLTLTPEDKEVRDWLVVECRSLGCEVKVDQMGNIFAIRPGTAKVKKPIAMGSHLDTQPAGGRYAHRYISRSDYAYVPSKDMTAFWVSKQLSKSFVHSTRTRWKLTAQWRSLIGRMRKELVFLVL